MSRAKNIENYCAFKTRKYARKPIMTYLMVNNKFNLTRNPKDLTLVNTVKLPNKHTGNDSNSTHQYLFDQIVFMNP
ncbi:hypothetical protein BpHYR1_034269 [Brachionus plicatilis]|uniref:Uncharacterized protein n=1 Tax=Brachionus plicatilis TaxID=10195 RepID=A0A3M7R4H4_BRAPC|nr:hypothetical protein BpHYR1_034269 [Brachionus plicatilis]